MKVDAEGFHCPGCGQVAAVALTGQAFCGNDDCHVWAWNPNKTLEEMAEDIGQMPPLAGGNDDT